MKRVLIVILVILVLAVIAIQFVPIERSNPPEGAPLVADAQVVAVLQQSCYDCHSNQTVWPWYSKVAPVSWSVANHVQEGRERLNFSEFAGMTPERQAHAREEIWDEVSEGGMPLPVYLKMHAAAALSDEDKAILKAWCGAEAAAAESDEADEDGAEASEPGAAAGAAADSAAAANETAEPDAPAATDESAEHGG